MSLTAVALAITLLLVLISWERRERRFADQQHDPLTGALRRDAFTGRAQRHVGRGHAVLMLDLNRVKEINDTYGHPIGDAVIAVVGRRLREALPSSSLVCRCGGDEFIATVPVEHATTDELHRLQAVLQLEVVGTAGTTGDSAPHGLTPGVSIGAGVGYQDFSSACSAADTAMYEDKHTESGPQVYTAAEHQPVLDSAPYPRTRDIQPA